MPELHELADKLRGQLDDLKVSNRLVPHSDPAVLLIELRLPADAAQALSRALESHAHPESEVEEEWEAVSAATSQIEGFTGGEASE